MQHITFIRIIFQDLKHKVVIGQGTLNFFQLCALTAQMFSEIIFLNTVPLALR